MTEKQVKWQKRNRILWRLKGMTIPIDTEVLTPVEVHMNLNPKEIEFYKLYIEARNQTVEELIKANISSPQGNFKYELEFKNFFIPLQDCIERDSKRPNPIGEEVIRKTYEKYKHIIGNNHE